ncbi:MAG: DUF192 domain-containing protein [Dehalococcoidia bacterium]|nr:MAG: DUF192 domain-containing protein [Dehalococcoidia bacterium]
MSSASSVSASGWVAVVNGGRRIADVRVARDFWSRGRGLLGRAALAPSEGLLIPKCASVHTWFMRFPIDVVYLGRDLDVRKVVTDLGPWRFSWCRGATSVLELPAGCAELHGLRAGDRLEIAGAAQHAR